MKWVYGDNTLDVWFSGVLDDSFQRRNLVLNLQYFLELFTVFDHNYIGLAVDSTVEARLSRVGRVDPRSEAAVIQNKDKSRPSTNIHISLRSLNNDSIQKLMHADIKTFWLVKSNLWGIMCNLSNGMNEKPLFVVSKDVAEWIEPMNWREKLELNKERMSLKNRHINWKEQICKYVIKCLVVRNVMIPSVDGR